ncbi:protease pro-enzyme activation domain-containing protein [uncultured Jatrophihabitans sp.]|uniref:S53 family peptidase n=1 Tax=uncultured Jatrophihabitans sp. TaxID=1610747 RepID=UPI0035CC1CE9
MHPRTIAAATVAAGTLVGSMIAVIPSTSATPPTPQAIPNTKPTWTASAQNLGAAKPSAPISARVYFAPKGGLAAVKTAVAAISTPGSAQYQQYLTQPQYQQRFGITAATVANATKYLRSYGLQVSAPSAGNHYVTITGTVKGANQAFGTEIARFQHDGQAVQAPAKTLAVPASLGAAILTVTGLDTTPQHKTPETKQDAPPPAGFRNGRPCSIYFGALQATYQADFKTKLPKFNGTTLSYAPCGYTGPQFRSAYEGNSTLTGKGVTVGIVDAYAAPTIAKDANTYATNHGDGSYTSGQLVQTVPASFTNQQECGPSGWYGEETLDVEAVHAMAPDAKIHYYGAQSCEDDDFTDTLQQLVDDNDVSIVSNSYGDQGESIPADEINAEEAVFLQGAAQGISFLFSSGDDGDELAATGLKQADYEASDPYVTAVGGTSTGIDGNGAISFEAGWGTNKYSLSSNGKSWTPVGFLYGAGGGESALFNQPAYQAKVTNDAYRQVPDVAMDADPNTGMLIGETQTFTTGKAYGEYRIGGTSLASPLFAGLTALTVQNAGKRAGFLNPTIYAKPGNFTDVKGNPKVAGDVRVDFINGENATDGLLYSVRTFGQDSSLVVTKGYDQVTGVGVPNAGWLTAFGTKK